MKAINLSEKFDLFQEHWSPKILGALNGQHVKIAKLKGDFVRHQHEHEDELFYVLEGELQMEFDDHTVTVQAGEFIIVPKGTYHKPIAEKEVKVLLFEPIGTINTGDNQGELTRENLEEL